MTLTPSGGGAAVSCTKRSNAGAISIYISDSDLTAQNYNLSITNSNTNNFAVMYGTAANCDGTVYSAGSIAWAAQASPLTSGSVTVGTDEQLIGIFGNDPSLTPTVSAGTLETAYDSPTENEWRIVSRTSTGAISVAYDGGHFKGACWAVLNKP
jgi:hypothetical protein